MLKQKKNVKESLVTVLFSVVLQYVKKGNGGGNQRRTEKGTRQSHKENGEAGTRQGKGAKGTKP